EREFRIFLRALVSELPWAVNLIAECPIFNLVWLLAAILAPLVSPVSVARFVAVFDPVARVVNRAEAGVDADVGLSPDHLAVPEKLVSAEAVALQIVPRQLRARRSLIFWPDAVFPVVA